MRDALFPRDRIPLREPELKHLDVNSGGYTGGVSYAGVLTALTSVVQGAAGNQRVGDAIRVRGIDFAIAMHAQGSSTGLRVILFAWNVSTSIGAPTIASVLQGAGVTPLAVVAPFDSDSTEQGRLDILFDHYFPCGTSPSTFSWRFRKSIDQPVVFDTGATTGTGTLRLLILSDAALAANSPDHMWWARVLFEDL